MKAGGAKELLLKVREVKGDGAFAHADWADAEVELADGTKVRLTGAGVFSTELLADDIVPFSFHYDGRAATELLAGWKKSRTSRSAAASRW